MEPASEQLLASGGAVALVIGFLIWAVKRVVENMERRMTEQAEAIKETGDKMVGALDKVNDSLAGIRTDIAEVKASTRLTADRVEAIAYANGDITPRHRSAPYGPGRPPTGTTGNGSGG